MKEPMSSSMRDKVCVDGRTSLRQCSIAWGHEYSMFK